VGGGQKKAAAPRKRPGSGIGIARVPASIELVQLVKGFHAELKGTGITDRLITSFWKEIFQTSLTENKLLEAYKKKYPANQLFESTLLEVSKVIKERTVIDRIKIQNLLINPETNIVKNGSNESSSSSFKPK
jgi:hypothetical protein